jgi:Tol biopolymer transport system component
MKLNYILAIVAVCILIAGCTTNVTIQSGNQDQKEMTTKQGEEPAANVEQITPGQILHLGIHTDQTRGLWVMNSDGSNLHKVLSEYVNAKWSPDNKKIAYLSGSLWLMNADGSTKAEVAKARTAPIGEFYWSPNGKYIAYDEKGVYAVNVAQRQEYPLVVQIGDTISSPTWADLEAVTYIEGDKVKKISANGSQTEGQEWLDLNNPTALKASPNLAISDSGAFWVAKDEKYTRNKTQVIGSVVTNYAWSPDSKLIVYEAGGKIHIYDVESNEEVASFAGHNEDRFSWSTDSKWILFTQKPAGAAEDIWIVNADGSGLKDFTNCPTACENPDWSH